MRGEIVCDRCRMDSHDEAIFRTSPKGPGEAFVGLCKKCMAAEREEMGVEFEITEADLRNSTDAQVWAWAFCERADAPYPDATRGDFVDEGNMIEWFANCMAAQEMDDLRRYPRTQAVTLIGVERERQMSVEGYTPKHDDEHRQSDMVDAAIAYALAGEPVEYRPWFGADLAIDIQREVWPWNREDWKPSDDPIRNLVKAGALIAAEIDRLLRIQDDEPF